MRVLVTGVSGFVGAHLARLLHERGDRVVGAGMQAPSDAVRALLEGHLELHLLEPESIVAAVAAARPDAVVHLAAQSSAGQSFRHPAETFQVNVLGTWGVLDAVRREAPTARVLVVGTGEMYGPQKVGTRVTEIAAARPVSPYAVSKAVADAAAETMGHAHGLDVVRTRSFGHLGAGQDTRFAIPAWAEQIAAAEAGHAEPVLKVGNLEVTRDLADVRDVVAAYIALLAGGHKGTAYNVCRGDGVRFAEVASMMVGRARIPIRIEVDPERSRPADVPYLVGDPSLIRLHTDWRATTPLEQSIDAVLDEWRSGRDVRQEKA